jgi:hypothetical protein
MGWTTEESGFDSRYGQEILLFSITSRPALGSTQPPIQWDPEATSPEVKRQGRGADPPYTAEVKNTSSRCDVSVIKPRYSFTFRETLTQGRRRHFSCSFYISGNRHMTYVVHVIFLF